MGLQLWIGESSPAVALDVKRATAAEIAKFYDTGSNGDALHNAGPIVGLSRISDGTVALDGPLFQVGIDTSSSPSYNIDETVFCVSNTGVGIGTDSPAVSLDLSDNTDAVALPTGTTAQRPSGTDAYIRKNSTNNALEFYTGTEWVEIITDYFPTGSTTLG